MKYVFATLLLVGCAGHRQVLDAHWTADPIQGPNGYATNYYWTGGATPWFTTNQLTNIRRIQ